MFGWWQTEIQWINSLKRQGVGGKGRIEWFVLLNNYPGNSAPNLPSQERSEDERWEGTQAAVGQVCGVGVCGWPGQDRAERCRSISASQPCCGPWWKEQQQSQCPGAALCRTEPDPTANPRVGGGSTWSATWTKDLGTFHPFLHSDPKQGRGKMWPNPSHWPRGKEPPL